MARKKRINKIALLIVGALVVLVGLGMGWHFRQPIKDYFFPKDAKAIEERGDASYEADEYQEAMGRFRRAAYWYKKLDKPASRDRAEFKQARAQLYVALKAPDLEDTVRTEHYQMAIAMLGNLLRRSPTFADPQRLLCDIAWWDALAGRKPGTGPWAKCVQQCTKLLDIEAKDHQSYFRRGYANARLARFLKGKYFVAAETDMRKAIDLKSDMPDYWMELARFLQARKMPNKAEEAFRDAMAANPDSGQLAVMYSVFLRREDRSDDALRQLQQVIINRRKDTLGYIALASFYRAEGDTGEALRILAIAKGIDDSDFRIYGTVAAIYSQKKEPENVVKTLRVGLAAIRRHSTSQPVATQPAAVQERLKNAKLQLTVMLANALLDMVDAGAKDRDKLIKEAHEHFSRIEEMAPKSAPLAKVAGRIALAEGNMLLAVKRLEEAYANYRTLDAKTVSLLVSLYLRQGLRGKAEEILDRILRLRRNAGTLVLKATLLIEYRQYDRAKENLRDALRIEPRHRQARNLLMALMATDEGGPLPEALEPTQRVVKLIINRTAEMMLVQERRKQAVRFLEELYKKTPTNQTVIRRLVNTYLAMGTPDEAKKVLQQAIVAQPDKAEAFTSMLENIGITPQQRFETQMAKAEKIEDKLQSALAKAAISAAARDAKGWLRYLDEAAAIAPTDARVVVQRFRYGLAAKNWKIVEDCVAKAKAANLDGCGGKLYAADLAIAREEIPQAIAELKAALKVKPGMKRSRVMLGQCYLRIRDVLQAREAFEAVARDDPGYASAAVGMARITEIQGKWSEHADWVNRARRLAPANPYVRERYLQQMAADRTQPEEIIKQREQILRERPRDMQNRLYLANLYERANRFLEAENSYRAIFNSNIGTRRFRANVLARFYARQRRFGEIDSIYNKMLAETTDTTEKIAMYVEYGWLLSGHSTELPIAAFNEAIKANEKDPRGHLAMGQYLGQRRQWAKAVAAFGRYLELRPDDRATQRRLAGFLIEAGRFKEAADRLQKLIASDASDAIAMTLRGVLKMRQGDMDAAEKAFNQVITENPNYGAALANRAQLYLFKGEHAKAKMDLRTAGRLTSSPTVLMQLGRFYVGFRDYDSAQLVFQDILARNSNYAPAIRGLMGVYMAQKSWARLEPLIADARKNNPKNVIYVLAEADMWRLRENIPRAVTAQAEALKMAPNSSTVVRVYLLGLLSAEQYEKVLSVSQPYANKEDFASLVAAISARALVKLNKPVEAERLFLAALQRARAGEMKLIVQQVRETYGLTDSIVKLTGWLTARPKSRDFHLLLGDLHVQANQATEAIKMYVKAFELADKPVQKAETRVRMGLLYHRYGKFPEAEKSYLEALKIIPNHSTTLNNLAYLYVSQMNQPAKALQYAERAFKQKPNDRNILDTYGWVLAALKQYDKAERFLNRSLQMGEALAPNLYHLGWVHEKTGRVTQAALRYQQALKLLADSKDTQLQKAVKEALERIKKPTAEGSGSK